VTALVLVAAGALLAGLVLGRLRVRRPASRRDLHSRLAAEAFPNGVLILFDRRLRHTFAAGRGLRTMGLQARDLEGRTVLEAFPAEIRTVLEPAYRAALEGRESAFELPLGDRDHLHRVVPVRNRTGAVVAGMLVAQDITDRKGHERRLKQWASRDGLTGLWNRERLLAELDRFLGERRRRDDRAGSLLFVDLDGFKAVNDSFGHAAGDDLLRAVAQAVESRVRYTDAVARIGGDEFAVLLPATTAAQAEQVAAKIAAAVDSLWPAGMRGGASVGVVELEPGLSAPDALAQADRAMYEVKRGRRIRRAS
jgi:diguanylate cyclase (GGDEF)-like protein/PAS domain S-box-containing protein